MAKRFYFTYGTGGDQPFYGGWSEVVAEDQGKAIKAYTAYHPMKNGLLNCCTVYSEEDFKRTRMFQNGNNFGFGCQEVITLSVTREEDKR